MILLWLTTGVAAAASETPVVEQRGKGGSVTGWRLREEHRYEAEDAPEQAVTIETVREAVEKIAERAAPAAPTPVEAAPPTSPPIAPTRPVATMFEPPRAEVVSLARPAPPDKPLTETERAALGAKAPGRIYDMELLLLLAA